MKNDNLTERRFYMRWREAFDDQEGWFTMDELTLEIKRIKDLGDYQEASINLIIHGKDTTEECLNWN